MRTLIKSWLRIICTFFAKLRLGSYGTDLRVNSFCVFTNNTHIGNHCNFNGMKISGSGKVMIGDYFHSGKNIRILTSNHNYEGNAIPYDDTYVTKDVIIGKAVWLGENVMILAGVTIGEGAIIQAGSIVVSDIPAMGIAGGHPAKVFKYRDIEHYNSLKEQNRYF